MAKTTDSSDDEFVEFEEDDGEIVVIKSVSQLLKEANMELDRRQKHINVLTRDLSDMNEEINMLKRELACHRNDSMTHGMKQAFSSKHDWGTIPSSSSSSAPSFVTSSIVATSPDEELLQKSMTESLDDFDILSSDKFCQTDFIIVQKKTKHKATQTRFDKRPQGIFQDGSTESNSNEEGQPLEEKSTNRISFSTAIGWPNAFKEVGLNMICHLKQTMDPFNITTTLENDAVIKDFEELIEGRNRMKTGRKQSCPSATTGCHDNNNGSLDNNSKNNNNNNSKNNNNNNLVKCPYCHEEMDSCSMQRHIQSMCGALDFLTFC